MPELGAEDADRETTRGGRPSAASVIAELWNEREQSLSGPPPQLAPADARRGRPRRAEEDTDDGGDGKKVLAGVVAVALLLGAGVGVAVARRGGAPSTATFVTEADAVCAPANETAAAAGRPSSYPDLATAAGTVAGATDRELAGLRGLERPGGSDGADVAALLSAMTQTNDGIRTLRDAAGRKDDVATATAAEKVRTSATDASTKARTLGFMACAIGMQPGIDGVVGGAGTIVKTAFVAKADTLCRAFARAVATVRLPRQSRDPRTHNQELARYIGDVNQLSEKLIVDLKGLPVPPGDTATVADTMGALDKALAKGKEARDAALSNDASRYAAVHEEATVLGTAVDAKLDAYGLTSCGSNFGSR